MTKDNDKRPSKPKTEQDIQRIQDFYKDADEQFGGFGEAEGSGLDNTPLLQEGVENPSDEDGDPSQPSFVLPDHDWIVHALTDLADYAKNEGLSGVHEALKEAQLRVAGILFTEALSKSATSSDPSEDDDT